VRTPGLSSIRLPPIARRRRWILWARPGLSIRSWRPRNIHRSSVSRGSGRSISLATCVSAGNALWKPICSGTNAVFRSRGPAASQRRFELAQCGNSYFSLRDWRRFAARVRLPLLRAHCKNARIDRIGSEIGGIALRCPRMRVPTRLDLSSLLRPRGVFRYDLYLSSVTSCTVHVRRLRRARGRTRRIFCGIHGGKCRARVLPSRVYP